MWVLKLAACWVTVHPLLIATSAYCMPLRAALSAPVSSCILAVLDFDVSYYACTVKPVFGGLLPNLVQLAEGTD